MGFRNLYNRHLNVLVSVRNLAAEWYFSAARRHKKAPPQDARMA